MLNKYRDKFVEFIIQSPKKTLLIYALMITVCTPGLVYVKANFTYKSWYSDKDPNVEAFLNFEKKFGNDDNAVIVVRSQKSSLNNDFAQVIKKLTRDIWSVEEVLRVDSLNNFVYSEGRGEDSIIEPIVDDYDLENGRYSSSEVARKIRHEKILENYLISKDQKTQLIIARIVPEVVKIPDHSKITNDIKKVLNLYRKNYPELEIYLTGSVVVVDDFTKATLND